MNRTTDQHFGQYRSPDSGFRANFNGSANPMITSDRSFIQFLGPGFWLLGRSDHGSQRFPGNPTFSLLYAGCHAVEKMTRNGDALNRGRSVMTVIKVAFYPRGPSHLSDLLVKGNSNN